MYPRHTLPYLTLPYLTLPYLTSATYATYRSKKQETSQKKTAVPKQQLDAVDAVAVVGGEPTNRVLKVPPKYLG